MAILSRFHKFVGKSDSEGPEPEPTVIQLNVEDKEAGPAVKDISQDDKPTENAQSGVQKIEAITLTWGRGSMFMVLILYVSCFHG